MIITIGTDIVSIDRFKVFAQDLNHPILKKLFTQSELDYCFSKDHAKSHLAVRFAGKEAVIKALYSRNIEDVRYKDIEIKIKQNGVPFINIKEKYDKLKFEISLSHCEDKALAFVIVQGDDEHIDDINATAKQIASV